MLRKSTVYDQGSHCALRKNKVMELKKILSLHPQLLSSLVKFESTWTKCINTINHCASGLRSMVPPTLGDLLGSTGSKSNKPSDLNVLPYMHVALAFNRSPLTHTYM